MRTSARRRVSGIITLVQEHRFMLERDGVQDLFLLAPGAPLEGVDLQRLARDRVPVEVDWSDAPDLIARIAHDVVPGRARHPARTRP